MEGNERPRLRSCEANSSEIMNIPSEIIYKMPAVEHDSAAPHDSATSHEKHKLTQPGLDILMWRISYDGGCEREVEALVGILGWEGGVVTRMRRGEKQAPVRSRRQQQHSLDKLLAPLSL
jgi:hypothetical protein